MPDGTPVLIQNVKSPKRKYIWGLIITLILLITGAISVRYLFSNELKHSSDFYSNGLRQYEDKNYNAALKSFECVIPLDIIRFALAHGKIEECSKLYLEKEFELAKNASANQLPREAIAHIDNVLGIYPKHETAIKLKTQYQADVVLIAESKVKAEAQKAKEKAYYDAVKSGTADVLSGLTQMNSILGNYNSSKAQALANSIMDISRKVEKVAMIDPPPGYEHVQVLYKQGAESLIKSLLTMADGNDKNDPSIISGASYDLGKSFQALKSAIDEMDSILTSHGISH